MNRPAAPTARAQDEPADIDEEEDANDGSDEDADSPARPIHDVSYVPISQRAHTSFANGGGGNSAMLILDEATQPPVDFSVGLPRGIQLSQLPDPRSVRKAMASPDADGWKDAMDQEMANLKSHDIYELVPRMNGMRTLKLGWVFHRKFKNGVFEENKGRLVARGNYQRHGIDYGELFSPVMRRVPSHHSCPRSDFATSTSSNLTSPQPTSTAHSRRKSIWSSQGCVAPGKKNWVWRLQKGLYGLVQAGRTWNEELITHIEDEGFTATAKDPAIYVKNS